MRAPLSRYPPALFSERFHAACQWLDRYVLEWAVEVANELDFARLGGRTLAPAQLCQELGLVTAFEGAATWLLRTLAQGGEVRAAGGAQTECFTLPPAPRPANVPELRREALEEHPSLAATLDLLDAAAAHYPEVARGAKQGEAALLGFGQASLWLRYFDNANEVYAVNNRVAAQRGADLLAHAESAFSILEIGAGTGSGSQALLEELAARGLLARLKRYAVTEPAAYFRRQAERKLANGFAGANLSFGALDMNAPWPEQGFAVGEWDLVHCVNVLHVAKRLSRTLEFARAALLPGGWLVAGECVRLEPRRALAPELVFQLLSSFSEVETDPVLRPHHGFLEPAAWRASFENAGFSPVSIEPELDVIRAVQPGFSVAVISGRRPQPL
jgi:SAM-dependent methyltransferase